MTSGQPSLVLMGLRGSGKSTLGRAIAARAGVGFIDIDDVTVSLLGGGTIPELWARLGEGAFREAETRGLRERVLADGAARRVVSLGGGTPTAPGAADLLRSAARAGELHLVYLRGQPATLRARLASTDTTGRPSLTGAGTLDEIDEVFAARDGLYVGLASLVIQIDGRSIDDLATELAALIG